MGHSISPAASMTDNREGKKTPDLHSVADGGPGNNMLEALSENLTNRDRFLLLLSILLVAFSSALGQMLSSVYEPYATASFKHHSLLATVNALQAAISIATVLTGAKLADVFGRMTLVVLSAFLYTLGPAIQASSSNLISFAVGAVFHHVGIEGMVIATTIIVADISSLRSRLFCSYVIVFPFLITAWLAGNISSAILDGASWRWGIGMWSIIYPVCAIPLLVCLYAARRRASKANPPSPANADNVWNLATIRSLCIKLFWQLDAIGILLLITPLALVLVPLSLAGSGLAQWRSAAIITPLVLGAVVAPFWVIWERRCDHPMFPPQLLKKRAVWASLLLAMLFETSHAMQGTFLYSFLVVAVGESVLSATRISMLYAFVIVALGIFISLGVRFRFHRLKLIIVLGNILFTAGFGLLIYTRGTISASTHHNIIVNQIFLGIGGAMYVVPIQVSVQAAVRHEYVAIICSFFYSCNFIGTALGNAVAGAVWNAILPSRLAYELGDAEAARSVFQDPFTYVASYAPSSPERIAVSESYAYTQKILCIIGLVFCFFQITSSLAIGNPELGEKRSLSVSDS